MSTNQSCFTARRRVAARTRRRAISHEMGADNLGRPSTISRSLIRISALPLLAAVLLSLVNSAVNAQEWSPPSTVWVEQAGQTVDGLFLDAWPTSPDLLGLPISEELTTNVELDSTEKRNATIQ
jgi:hypothetical protein